MQDTNQAPASWLGHKLINQAAAEAMGATVLPSANSLAGRVWLTLTDSDGDQIYVAGIVVGVTFTAEAVRYSVAFQIAPQPSEGETMYAVVENIGSSWVLSELPDDETVFDAVLTEDAALLLPTAAVVPVPAPILDSADAFADIRMMAELEERKGALESALRDDADPKYAIGVAREVIELAAKLKGTALAEFDPTSPTGYAMVLKSEALAVEWQDRLDSFFQGRLIDVRNALRTLGWDGERNRVLSKNSTIARFDFWQVGAGKNIVGMTINGIQDDLAKTAGELAAEIDATAALPEPAAPVVVAELTGRELGEFADTPDGSKARRAAAKGHFKEKLIGTSVFNASLNSEVGFNGSGMDKVISFSADPRKLKLVPALPKIIADGLRTRTEPSKRSDSNVVAVHVLKAVVMLDAAALTVRVLVREQNDGTFFYDHAVNKEDLGGNTEILDSVDSTKLSLPALPCPEPSEQQVLLDSVGSSGKIFNLFIEGEAPEVTAEDEETGPSAQFITYRDWIAKELADGKTIPAGTMEVIRMDTRLEDGEAEQLEALATKAPAPQEKRSMEQIIKIAADTLAQLRRIDVFRVLDAAGDQRAELATYIATGRPDLVREVTDVMAEEWPGLGWAFTPAADPAPVESGNAELEAAGFKNVSGNDWVKAVQGEKGKLQLNIRAFGTPEQFKLNKSATFTGGITGSPSQEVGTYGSAAEAIRAAQAEAEAFQTAPAVNEGGTAPNPQRAADIALLNSVISQSVDMWADDLADKIEGMMTAYENDGEMMELASRAIDSYTDFMLAAA